MLYFLGHLAKQGSRFLRFLAGLIAFFLFAGSAYILYDIFYSTYLLASSTWELEQYKPDVEKNDLMSFEDLCQLNPDICSWITIDNSSISYPVLQGETNLTYANLNYKREPSLTGAIYLDSGNHRDYSDAYSVIYGHNINASEALMFGSLGNYKDAHYFETHKTGTLTTLSDAYRIDIFAYMLTDAYDSMVYAVQERDLQNLNDLQAYIKEKAVIFDTDGTDEFSKILCLSTCANTGLYDRTTVFAGLTHMDTPFPVVIQGNSVTESQQEPKTTKTTLSHPVMTKKFAVSNLLLILTGLYLLVPVGHLKHKYQERKPFLLIPSLLLETLMMVLMTWMFIQVENIRDPITLVDRYTPYFWGSTMVMWLTDRIFLSQKRRGEIEK